MLYSLTELVSARFPSTEGFRVTETLVADIQKELDNTKLRTNPVKIAARFGVPPAMVRFIMQETPSPNTEFTKLSEDGWGRKELRPFLVSRKASGDGWPEADEAKIEEVREAYDAGLVEICQGRDGDFILLYAIVRKRQVKRVCPYFSEAEVEVVDDEH